MEGSLVAYKVFTNGSTLQASELNENLMQQAVATFSNVAARTAAITAPVEGQVTYLEDSNTIQIYDGSSWKVSLATTGSVLQVVQATTTTQAATSSTTYVTSGLQVAITPKSTSSKILILVGGDYASGGAGRLGYATVFRGGSGGTNLETDSMGAIGADGTAINSWLNLNYLDSPNTTSSTTYTVMFRAFGGSVGIFTRFGSITLLEIAG
jgi:hypothetical protein